MFAVGTPVDSPGGRGKLVGVVMGEATVSLDKGGLWSGPVAKVSKIETVLEVKLADNFTVTDDLTVTVEEVEETGEAAPLPKLEAKEIEEPLDILDLPARMTKAWLEKQDRQDLQDVLDADGSLSPARRKRIEGFLRGA